MQKLESHTLAYIYLVLKVPFFFALSLFLKKNLVDGFMLYLYVIRKSLMF